MTTLEADVRARLQAAAGHIRPEPDLGAVLSADGRAPGRRPPRWATVAVAATVIAAATVGLLVVTSRHRDRATTTAPPSAADAAVLAPYVAGRPAFVDGWTTSEPPIGRRQGRWVSGAVGVADGGGFTDVISVSAFDQTYWDLSGAEDDFLGGVPAWKVRHDGWTAFVTATRPALMVSGFADEDVLRTIAAGAEVVDDGGALSYRLGALPSSYDEIVGPTVLGDEPVLHPMLISEGGGLLIEVLDGMPDTRLSLLMGSRDIAPVDVGGTDGWVAEYRSGDLTVTAIDWSPHPGVVVELRSQLADVELDDLLALAASVQLVPLGEWRETYS